MKPFIRVLGINDEVLGKCWESDSVLRVGKQSSLEIVLSDSSVSRNHAELKAGSGGWTVRDLVSTNGTFVNGVRLGVDERTLRSHDFLQFGKLAMIVELIGAEIPASSTLLSASHVAEVLAQSVEIRDWYTGDHSARVTRLALLLAGRLSLPQDEIELLLIGVPLHDLGKIGIEDAILRKPGPLTQDEYRTMQTHTLKGDAIISPISNLQNIRPIVRSHHERWEGTGYPTGWRATRFRDWPASRPWPRRLTR